MRILVPAVLAKLIATSALAASPGPREGWATHATGHGYAVLIDRVKEAAKTEGMGIVTEAGPTEVARKRGVEIPGNRVIGIFNNVFAVRALGLSPAAMIEAPIRMYVTENADGTANLSYKTPSLVFSAYPEGGEALQGLAAELDVIFAAIAARAVAEQLSRARRSGKLRAHPAGDPAMTQTEPLFRDDAYLQSCTARVVSAGEGGVILDRTICYPTGGGQPGDTGVMRHEGGEARITDTVKGEGGAILHLIDGPAPAEGAEVDLALDWERRHALMRMHTALHLLSVVIPLPVSGGSVGAEKSRLDFDMPEAPEDKAALEAAMNALIEADHPVSTEWITDDELRANPEMVKTMSVMPPMGQGRVRLVRIGDIDLQPCGGTHVRSTGEIGRVVLGKIEKKGRQNRRVNVLWA